MLDQFSQSEELISLGYVSKVSLNYTFVRLQEIAEKHPGLVPDEELAKIKADHDNAKLDEKVFIEASKRRAKQWNRLLSSISIIPLLSSISIIPQLVVVIALATAVPLLLWDHAVG